MKRTVRYRSGLGVLAIALAGCTADAPTGAVGERVAAVVDAEAAEVAFAGYQAALVERRGADAAAVVSARTLDYYGAIGRMAVDGTPDELAGRSIVDRLTVALLRVVLPVDVLNAATPADLFAATVEAGLVGEQVGALVPRATRVQGRTANVQAVDSGGRLVEVTLRREGGIWKVDVAGLLRAADASLRQLAATQGISEDELVLATVSALTGQSVGPSVFNPPFAPET